MLLLVEGPLIKHESLCEKREVKCHHAHRGCKAVMPFDKRALHVTNDCMYEIVICPFSSVGCNDHVLRKDIESHEEVAMKQHNRLLLQDQLMRSTHVQVLQQKIDEQAASIEDRERREDESIVRLSAYL